MTIINGCQLPTALVDLLRSGRWRRPEDVETLRNVTGLSDADQLLFCDPVSMRVNTEHLVAELQRDPGLFGLASSRTNGAAVSEPMLDIDQAVVVAATFGDGILCLDYRASRERPAVVVSDWSTGQARWRRIAADVEELSDKLGL
jgi:hypothetical protein